VLCPTEPARAPESKVLLLITGNPASKTVERLGLETLWGHALRCSDAHLDPARLPGSAWFRLVSRGR